MSAGSWLGWEDIHWMLVVPSHGLAPEMCGSRKLAEHKHGCISFPLSWLWMWCTLHWAPTLTSLLSWAVMWNCKPTKPFLPSLVFFFFCQNILLQPWKRDQNNIYSSKQVLRMQYTLSRSTSTYGWHPFPSWAEWNISVKNINSWQ